MRLQDRPCQGKQRENMGGEGERERRRRRRRTGEEEEEEEEKEIQGIDLYDFGG